MAIGTRSAATPLAVLLILVASLSAGTRPTLRYGLHVETETQTNGVTCHTEYVPMRDGTLLATDVYLPATPGRYPVIMQRTPYGLRLGHGCFEGLSASMAFWAEHGYVGLTQDVRGTFRSEGVFQPIFQEQDDGYDAVEWAAAQPWSTGPVGMTGASYFGLTQWQAAVTTPPHLAAIAPSITASDYHDHWTYANGVFDVWMAQSWLLNYFASDEYRRQLIAAGTSTDEARQASDEWLAQGKQKVFSEWVWQLPLTEFQEFRTLAPYYYEWLEHPNYDEYWAKIDLEHQWQHITVPALVHGSWRDLFAIGSVRSFAGMRTAGGSPLARSGTMLVMQGGGGHGGTGVLNFGPDETSDLQALRLQFYDHYLKGLDNAIDREPRVQLFVAVPPEKGTDGSGFWVTGETFPLPGNTTVQFNLRSGGRANTRQGDGVLDMNRPSAGPGDTFVYDPSDPVPSHGGGLCCASLNVAVAGSSFASGAQDQSALEMRDDVLVYTSAPLTEALIVLGPVNVTFWATSSARDTDFVAKLVDVRPDGTAYSILERVIRARFRHGSKSAPSLIEPGKAYKYDLDLGNTGNLFHKGHRVRLDITSSKFPHYARNLNTGSDVASDDRIVAATQTVLHDAAHRSYVELSVAPDVTNPSGSSW
jgi:putative CocE/NonD family hydrolase